MNLRVWKDLVDMIYPSVCAGCQRPLISNESCLCLYCLSDLPKTTHAKQADNEVMRLFKGRVPLQKAGSFLYFTKGSIVQSMLFALKYRGSHEVGSFLGKMAAQEFGRHGFFEEIDLIVPVPLHPKKLRKRGYNQSEIIARAMADEAGLEMCACIQRATFTETQTRKSRFARWLNVETAFRVGKDSELEGKHILLVDDVVTTGSTAESCLLALKQTNSVRLSFFALACAK